MATKGMIETIINLHKDYIYFSDPLYYDLISFFEIHTYGARYLNCSTHLSITGPDDFANGQLGKMIEAISSDAYVTTFSDLSLQSKTNQKKATGTTIIYVEKKLRHSEDYERLCHLMRNTYFENGQAISRKPPKNRLVVIIGNGGLIDRKIINFTIPLYVTPFQKHVPGFFYSKLEKDIKKVRALIKKFWEDDLSTILRCYNTFPQFNWLKNQDEQSWLPILAPAKAYSERLCQPIHFEQMLTLAEKIVKSRKMEESAVSDQQKVLEATLAFIKEKKPMDQKPESNSKDDFYYGPEMFEFIQTMLDPRKLTKERISEILNDHDIVKDTWRPRIEESVINEEESREDNKKLTKKKKEKKIIQPMCYAFDKEQLSEVLKTYL